MAKLIQVEVVYALPRRHWHVRLTLPASSSVLDAYLSARSELPNCPWPCDAEQPVGADMDAPIQHGATRASASASVLAPALGKFGKRCAPDTLLLDGDRVEVYRPLQIDPKDARRTRAKQQPVRVRQRQQHKSDTEES